MMLERFYGLKQWLNTSKRFEANVEPTTIEAYLHNGVLERTVGYLLGTLRTVTDEARLLLVIDGNRKAIYDGEDPRGTFPYKMNQLLRAQTDRYDLPLIDLTDWFEEAWKREGERFDWVIDYHWNQRGHWLAAAAIREFITANQRGSFCHE